MDNVYPIHKKFIVKADEGAERSEAGIWLAEKTQKFTGTVRKLPADILAIDTATEEEYEKESQIKEIGAGRLIKEGTRIQWSSQSGFATPISINEEDYLLFTIHDVDLIIDG
jgi:co-chaperonin GroES (HSP10)